MKTDIEDPRKIDRSLHSFYVKFTGSSELHIIQNVEQYKDSQIIYYYDDFYYTVNDTYRIYDWTLNPRETDLMFQYAIKTYKEHEKRLRELKKEAASIKNKGQL